MWPRDRWRGRERALSAAERACAAPIFGAALDWDRIRIRCGRAYVFQPADTAMAPDGHIYFPDACYRPCFAGEVATAAWLVHELTHVWQYQQGRWLKLVGLWQRRYRYGDIAPAAVFARFGIEQQAAIVEDYFRLRHGAPLHYGRGTRAAYERLIPFLPAGARQISPASGLDGSA